MIVVARGRVAKTKHVAPTYTGPALGAHGKDFDLHGSGTSPSTVTINTQASGSALIAISFGDAAQYSIGADSKGNTLSLLESSGYSGGLWPGYGLELYGLAGVTGGSSHAVSLTKTTGNEADESTLIVVEVTGASSIHDTSVIARAAAGAGVAYSGSAVTTTGQALLLSIWGGDGDQFTSNQTATPENGWTMVESEFLGNTSYIQAAVAYKTVNSSGSYNCDWTPTANQGAIVAMVAVQ